MDFLIETIRKDDNNTFKFFFKFANLVNFNINDGFYNKNIIKKE